MGEKETRKVAIVTYNRVGEGQFPNGIQSRPGLEVYFAQNGHLAKWTWSSEETLEEKERARKYTAAAVVRSIRLDEMDEVYLYVGNNGGEEAIRQSADLTSEKVNYVMCSCNYGYKKDLIRRIGNGKARIIECECGGRETLATIANQLLKDIKIN
ncbi:MAG TPA: hypothetical protein VHA12_02885 [Candidatus Nanoarchaeia archaeon]|nr:hypothetical protein [Candidatus Nanoarchaeia archaeon]